MLEAKGAFGRLLFAAESKGNCTNITCGVLVLQPLPSLWLNHSVGIEDELEW